MGFRVEIDGETASGKGIWRRNRIFCSDRALLIVTTKYMTKSFTVTHVYKKQRVLFSAPDGNTCGCQNTPDNKTNPTSASTSASSTSKKSTTVSRI